ncbi:MAG: class I SAM-dependent methyltransferase [Pseudonocardiales bacterium]|nr:class I SAM-dependent methyltransferase [Pseudonocardiales bacterium]
MQTLVFARSAHPYDLGARRIRHRSTWKVSPVTQLPDFDATYQGRPVTPSATRVPWNIGEPQPAIAALIAAGQVSSPVLDAGCGIGETAIELGARGYEVVGIDTSPAAIAQARRTAQERGVAVEFVVADITTFGGYDGHFATVIDSTLFHSLAIDQRAGYLAAIARAARQGATLDMLVFDRRAPLRPGSGPNAVDETELRDAVGPHWTVDAITPSSIHAWTPQGFAAPLDRDEQGRALFPAFLLRAHLPDDQLPRSRQPVAAHPQRVGHRP